MPVTDEGDLLSGQFVSTYTDGVDAFAEDMTAEMAFADLNHASWVLGIWSAPQTVPPPVPATLFTPVTSWVIDVNPGTMRSRRLGQGS